MILLKVLAITAAIVALYLLIGWVVSTLAIIWDKKHGDEFFRGDYDNTVVLWPLLLPLATAYSITRAWQNRVGDRLNPENVAEAVVKRNEKHILVKGKSDLTDD